jgi:hypothetical protein
MSISVTSKSHRAISVAFTPEKMMVFMEGG